MATKISILYPDMEKMEFRQLPETACHDLGMDMICQKISEKEAEQKMLMNIISKMTSDADTARFRGEVFEDILHLPKLREEMMKLLEQVKFLKDFGSFKRDIDKKVGMWDLLHRLDEINDYIKSVEAIRECLAGQPIKSEGLLKLRKYVDDIYEDSCFAEMKKDIESLNADTSNLRSITVGINLNERFEAEGIGLISVNNKPFKSSNIVSNFTKAMTTKHGIKDGNEWNGDMHYEPIHMEDNAFDDSMKSLKAVAAVGSVAMDGRLRQNVVNSIVNVPEQDATQNITGYMDKVVNQLLTVMVKRLREVLTKYVSITINSITDLIPEFLYYIRFAEFIEKLMEKGYSFCRAEVLSSEQEPVMRAKGIYNLKLAASGHKVDEIVPNDLDFDRGRMVYVLTGANRGGKTTITQAVGQMFVLAQGGIYVPGNSFEFVPADAVYTHFPADEDKTMDLGRLGEECIRFKEMYQAATNKSLLLLNESFSTTSFEEGYYIAKDSIKAILAKGVRTIYNTHMHKLGFDIDEFNEDKYPSKAASLIVCSEGGNRSFKVEIAPPEGKSYASDIAEKYGVTLEQLVGKN